MQTLKSLTLAAIPQQRLNDPVLVRRGKLIARLCEQKALLADPAFVAVDHRWETNSEGRKERIAQQRKVRSWWKEDASGAVYLVLRYGQKMIEIEKGKPAISMPSKEALDGILDLLVAAVGQGELDNALASISKARSPRKKAAA